MKGFPGGSDGKQSACNAGDPGFTPWVGKIPWRRKWQPTWVFLPGKSQRQRSLAGYSPWCCKRVRHDFKQQQSLYLQRPFTLASQPPASLSIVSHLSCVWLCATLWTIALQVPLPMRFSRQKYWSGLPFPSPGDLLDPGIQPASPALAGGFFATEPPGKPS